MSPAPSPHALPADSPTPRRVGVAVVGLGGAVATTAAAGLELLRLGARRLGGPAAGRRRRRRAWSRTTTWSSAAGTSTTATWPRPRRCTACWTTARSRSPARRCRRYGRGRPSAAWSSAATSTAATPSSREGRRAAGRLIRADLRRFREERVARRLRDGQPGLHRAQAGPRRRRAATPEAFEAGLDSDDPAIGPGMLYAYAAIVEGCPTATSRRRSPPTRRRWSSSREQRGVPVAGKDGKTGQTMMKTVLAPALPQPRAARRGLVLHQHPRQPGRPGAATTRTSWRASSTPRAACWTASSATRSRTTSCDIRYYRPRGDDKEAWDNIDIVGFLGQRMQIKVNFLCKD